MQETGVSERKMIVNLHNQGYSFCYSKYNEKRSRFTIRSVIKRFSNQETVISAPRCGRPEKLSVAEKREIINTVKKTNQYIVGNSNNHKKQF